MDPLPPTGKVLSIILQEERQRSITPGILSYDLMPTKEFNSIVATSLVQKAKLKKDVLICSHCNIQGHTMDKCYKLHGYPPGYKFKSKTPQTEVHVNQTSSTIYEESSSSDSVFKFLDFNSVSTIHNSMEVLMPHPESQQLNPLVSNFNGIFSLSTSSFPTSSFLPDSWILDTCATHHVCCAHNFFIPVNSIANSFITLPNGSLVPIAQIPRLCSFV